MNNQDAFLARTRSALGKVRENARPEDAKDGYFTSEADDALLTLLDGIHRTRDEQLDLLAVLKESAGPLNLQVHEVATMADAAEGIVGIARTTDTEWGGNKQITTHDTPFMAELDLAARLKNDGIAVEVSSLQPGEDEPAGKQRLREQAIASYIGVTGGDWCAVDCGALVILAGPGRARATSLVPSVHIAVLKLDQLTADLTEIYAHFKERGELPISVNFISGPSKTADIEATLVHGAHGPREMHIFVVTD